MGDPDVAHTSQTMTFPMPAADVTIEAMYESAENARETELLGSAAMIGAVGISAVVLAYQAHVGDLRIDATAPESHPMFEPPGSPVGLVGMPLPGEEQDHRPGPDPLAAARTGLEIALPARYVDQLVLLQDAPLAGVENMGFGMLRLRVGTVRRDRLVPGRRDDQPPRLVVAADVEILYVAAR